MSNVSARVAVVFSQGLRIYPIGIIHKVCTMIIYCQTIVISLIDRIINAKTNQQCAVHFTEHCQTYRITGIHKRLLRHALYGEPHRCTYPLSGCSRAIRYRMHLKPYLVISLQGIVITITLRSTIVVHLHLHPIHRGDDLSICDTLWLPYFEEMDRSPYSGSKCTIGSQQSIHIKHRSPYLRIVGNIIHTRFQQ